MVNQTAVTAVSTASQVDWGRTLVLLGLIAVTGAVVGWMYYVDVKHKPDEKRATQPVMVAGMLTLILFFLMLIGEMFEVFEKGFIKDHWYLLALLFAVTYVVLWREHRKRNPLSEKVLLEKAIQHIDNTFDSTKPIGNAYTPVYRDYRVKENPALSGMRASVASYVITRRWAQRDITFLLQLNTYTGYVIMCSYMPKQHEINRETADDPVMPAIGNTDQEE